MAVMQRYLNKWLNKRIPAAAAHKLNHHNIFIFPAKFGLLFLSLCVLLFLLGTNYQNNLMLLLCYFLLAIFLVNLLASYINFARIDLQIGKCAEVYVDDNLNIPLWLNANNDDYPTVNGLLHFTFQNQPNKQQNQAAGHATVVDANDLTNPINVNLKCLKRGKLSLSRVTVESYYPLGLYRCWTHLAFTHQITVFPKPLPCQIKLEVNKQSDSKKEGELTNQHSGHDDFSHLKAYQTGEPLNHVAWKQLAKGRGLISKQFSAVGQHIGWLKLSAKYTKGFLKPSNTELALGLEKELSELCYQVIELSRKQAIFGLDLGTQLIAPSSGTDHRQACLQALACFAQPQGKDV